MIEIKNLTKYYNTKTALSNINLNIPQGEIIGLFGENGAGKTTLMKCILGYIRYKGSITLDGEQITSKNIAGISFATCEHSFFSNLTPKAHKEFYEMHFPGFMENRFYTLMEFFQLPMNRSVGKFSTGQKNQFEVIMALSQGAKYIFMDEPFAGNDIFNREDFYKVVLGIIEPHETIVLSTHLLEEVEKFIGKAILLHNGRLIGEITTSELDELGTGLIPYIKEKYQYKSDRVGNTLSRLTDKK